MRVTVWAGLGDDKSGKDNSMPILLGRPYRGPGLRRRPDQLPRDHRLPDLHRQLSRRGGEQAAEGELARDRWLALVEAAFFAADEPLTTRKLAAVAGLADGNEARRLIRNLQALYDQDGTAF